MEPRIDCECLCSSVLVFDWDLHARLPVDLERDVVSLSASLPWFDRRGDGGAAERAIAVRGVAYLRAKFSKAIAMKNHEQN